MNTNRRIQIIVSCLLLFIMASLNVNAQWVKSNSTVSPNGYLSYPHPSAAYCSHNGGGEIYKSVDSGETWQLIHDFGPFTTTSNVLFINADTGFVQQYHRMHKTLDGGQTWQLMPDLFSPAFTQSHFHTLKNIGNTLYISAARGDTSFVFQSTDYGTSFNIIYQQIEQNAEPFYVSFYSDNSAYMVHSKNDSTVFITHNQFASIDTIPYSNASIGRERIMSFVDSNRGFFYGTSGAFSFPTRLRRLSNNSIRMDLNNLDATGILPVIDMELRLHSTSNRVYACSEYGKIFWSANYGQHWNEQHTPVNQTVRSIAFAAPNIGIAVAADGVIYTSNGGDSPNGLSDRTLADEFQLYPNPARNEVYIQTSSLEKVESIQLLNTAGELIKRINDFKHTINLSGLPSGNYFVIINTKDGRAVKPFTKN